jgi:hypothetical protein
MEKQEDCNWYSLTHLPDPSPTLSSIIDSIEFSVYALPLRKKPRFGQSRHAVKQSPYRVANPLTLKKNQRCGP